MSTLGFTLILATCITIATAIGYIVGQRSGYDRGRQDYQEARDRAYYAPGSYYDSEQAQGYYKGPSRDEGGGHY